MSGYSIVRTNKHSEGRPCRNCGLLLWQACVSGMSGGSESHAWYYCLTCGLILGLVSRERVLAYYADGNARPDAVAMEQFFARFTG